ncbi:oocyte zinc finger protein XlCOF26-like [Culicoides brevitarsis]|uniref:oocyte zinc finger protein XlCOF26-like n=1 Tax=Culicoides brevitarsis TaxID=469753 RepID=UPI00307C3AD3
MENCRVCLKIPTFPTELSQKDKKSFFQITGVELNESKQEILCKKCYSLFMVAIKFRSDAIKSDEFFQKLQLEVEPEVNPELKFEVFIEEGQETLKIEPQEAKKCRKSSKEPYICHFCDARMLRYQDLVAHMKAHKRERRMICRCCDKKFTDKLKLANHERSYRRQKLRGTSLVCQHCGSVYPDPKSLAMHARIHTGVMNFKCTIEGCTEAFREKRAYYSHFVLSHGIKKPCVCLDCGTSYTNHISLRTHRRMHHTDQEKLFECVECPGKKFLTKRNLDDHIAFKHRGERHFQCTACPKSYGNSKNLRRHLRDNHQELYLEMVRTGKRIKKTKIEPS